MKKLSDILSKYEILLFDMDGVITSEKRYWDAAALTVYEYLNPDLDPAKTGARAIYDKVTCGGKTVTYLKEAGVNSNWDTAYVILSAAKILGVKDDFKAVYDYISDLSMGALEMYAHFGKNSPFGERGGQGYQRIVDVFQEWYLGSELYEKAWQKPAGEKTKKGLIWFEEPIVPLKTLTKVLKTLCEAGLSLGIGTGRVRYEIDYPLKKWDIEKYFDENRIVTYTEIINAEKSMPGKTLTKPHPFMFIKGMTGLKYDNYRIIGGDYDKALAKKTLVIGDAGADILAAQGGGMDFAAVLTGISGQRARRYFEQMGATHILNDISELIK
ncbi:MAG: Pyrophosphatase PpaX [Firmicutes bacterium ADurb.Bin193]|nr:MAG: Pyrophosphatase PpaX [Firmicutes bacterium ADurb.Bin193]